MFKELKMDLEKDCLIKLLNIHLERGPRTLGFSQKGIHVICENFSRHYGDQNPIKRCLLDEYRKENGELYLDLEEVKALCLRFRQEQGDKCSTHGEFPEKDIWTEQELQELLKEIRKKYETDKNQKRVKKTAENQTKTYK